MKPKRRTQVKLPMWLILITGFLPSIVLAIWVANNIFSMGEEAVKAVVEKLQNEVAQRANEQLNLYLNNPQIATRLLAEGV